jgi:hypothetical protein
LNSCRLLGLLGLLVLFGLWKAQRLADHNSKSVNKIDTWQAFLEQMADDAWFMDSELHNIKI